jgi:hypothetical protein
LALSEWHLTPHQINHDWTEEQLVLMFKKRYQRLKRMAEEIEKMRSRDSDEMSGSAEGPRVSSEAFLSRIQKIQKSGGRWAHGEI